MRVPGRLLLFLLPVVSIAVRLPAQSPLAGEDRPVELAVFPAAVRIDDADDRPLVVASLRLADGRTRDVSRVATMRIEPPALARFDDGGDLRATADGEGSIIVVHEGLEARIPLRVTGFETVPEPDFRRDVISIFTRLGCNAGGCHGAAAGKNGFRLSLFGFDPRSDHERLTRELKGRRCDRNDPSSSLVLEKPAGLVPHRGGKRLAPDDRNFRTIADWIGSGARFESGRSSTLAGIEVGPRELVLDAAAPEAQVRVRASWADGSDRDVTELAILSSSDDQVAAVHADGRIRAGRPGSATIMARFGTQAEIARVIVLPAGKVAPRAPTGAASGPVDRFLFDRQAKLRVERVERCSDGAFIRRATLDLLNLVPTADETREFLADPDPAKREHLVDALLLRPELDDMLTLLFADVMGVAPDTEVSDKMAREFVEWLRTGFRARRPFDAIVREILTATGSCFENPAAVFFAEHRDPKVAAENVAQVFLGIRLQCAQCHNHPFERWTLDDYYGFASFFAQTGVKRAEDPRDRVVYLRPNGEVPHVLTKKAMPTRPLGGEVIAVPRGEDPRAALADWVLDPANPLFARTVANRLFAKLMGRGIVDPVDDVRASNPPSHPELLDALAARLVETRYDLRDLLRSILLSESYGLASAPDPLPAFASAKVQRLSAEQLLDAIVRTTGVPVELPGLGPEGRAGELAAPRKPGYFLEVFGRPDREGVCACSRRDEPSLSQALHLINGETVARALRDPQGRIRQLLAAGAADAFILDELWLAAFARPVRADELDRVLAELASSKDRTAVWEDVLWAVLNAKEFLFNH